jgi:hypothetical protein
MKKNELVNNSRYWPLFEHVQEEEWLQGVFDIKDRGQLPPRKKCHMDN